MENLADRYPLIENAVFFCRTGPTFLEPLDDDEATVDEAMDNEEDNADEEANVLMAWHVKVESPAASARRDERRKAP
ncbi:hypothetical protein H5410_035803 [Solanum commersonii]|uniref:Uncharacterized protein n=1 Tax=Solanum commersonii TaxID=4109 RepID=A0A9J5Y1R0_SOLCO|nr:hypothetical protein H5410_035803 [Solanum commersonii]